MSRKLHAESASAGALMGTNGADIVSDTNAHVGPYFGILAITDTVINTATLESSLISGSINGITLYAGSYLPLYGINSITLTSGTAVLYKM